jgi:hypothetical protein
MPGLAGPLTGFHDLPIDSGSVSWPYAADPELLGALLSVFGYRPDDIYLTSGPLYHSGPSAFMGIGLLFGQTIVVQRKFEAGLYDVAVFGIPSDQWGEVVPARRRCTPPGGPGR